MDIVTWKKIFEDFKKRHPKLSLLALDYSSYDYATILIHLRDGAKMIYDYDSRRAKFLSA